MSGATASSRRSSSQVPRHRLSTDTRLFLLVLTSAVPTLGLLAYVAVATNLPTGGKLTIAFLSITWIIFVASAVREHLVHHIRTLSNLVEAIRAEDYSLKGTRAREPGELAELYQQVNALTDKLKASRQGEQELLNILEKVVNQINVAIVACDADNKIRLVNELASKLLKTSADTLVGTDYDKTALATLPLFPEPRLVDYRFPGGEGRWQVSQQFYRHRGRPSRIVFIADLKQVLSEEEVIAWQRLIRVIAHEVNNSLTPITSICQTVETLLSRSGELEHQQAIAEGLQVIAERAKGLKDFISVYARIARLPEPQKVLFSASTLLQKVEHIFRNQAVVFADPVPTVDLFGDPVHLEQVLINLVKNALEANKDTEKPVEIACSIEDGFCELQVRDQGSGISNPDNLFVPFYTTKDQGAGIGLALSRQIAARHNGEVRLENRLDGPGAVATLRLPLPVGSDV